MHMVQGKVDTLCEYYNNFETKNNAHIKGTHVIFMHLLINRNVIIRYSGHKIILSLYEYLRYHKNNAYQTLQI